MKMKMKMPSTPQCQQPTKKHSISGLMLEIFSCFAYKPSQYFLKLVNLSIPLSRASQLQNLSISNCPSTSYSPWPRAGKNFSRGQHRPSGTSFPVLRRWTSMCAVRWSIWLESWALFWVQFTICWCRCWSFWATVWCTHLWLLWLRWVAATCWSRWTSRRATWPRVCSNSSATPTRSSSKTQSKPEWSKT